MSYFLTEDQRMIQSIAREFTEKEVKPRAMEIHRANAFPHDLHKRAAELGFIGTLLPTSVGGNGLGYTELTIICEEIAKESPGFSMSLSASMITPGLILTHSGLIRDYMPGILSGDTIVQTAMTDPKGSTNHAEWEPFAVREGDAWVLNGTKLYATNNGVGNLVLSIGLTNEGKIGLFAVIKGDPGFDNSYVEKKLGFSGQNSGTINFQNVRLPLEREVPFDMSDPENKLFTGAYVGMAAVALGAAEGVHAKTVEFAKVRTRNFKPIASLQVVAHKLAHNETKIELSKALLYQVARMMDDDQPSTRRLIHMAKAWITEAAVDIGRDCIQLHGGMGYMDDTGIGRYMLDALGTTIGDMVSDSHYQSVAALMGLPDQEFGA
jgi:alkylation response protein AidB-like acyl-CoA dehydrogenase